MIRESPSTREIGEKIEEKRMRWLAYTKRGEKGQRNLSKKGRLKNI